MPTQDLHNNLQGARAFSPEAATTNDTPLVCEIIDTAQFDSLEFFIAIGELADSDATFTVLVESDTTVGFGSATSVSDDDLLGTEAGTSFTFAADDTVRKIGYIGSEQFVRLTVTPANNTGNAFITVIAIQGHARKAPVS